MLPGFRFLFAAILLSASILVFGLGAAALLRSTHEQFVSNPSWRNGPQEQAFAQASEPAQPVLAAFRAEPPLSSTSIRDEVPTIGLPESGPEQIAALTSQVSSEPVAPAGEPATTEAPLPPAAPSPLAETPAPQSASAETTPSASETMPATAEAAPTPVNSPEPQQADAASAVAPSEATTEVAALAAAATAVPQDLPAKAERASDTSDKQATKHRAKKRHRIVRRAATAASAGAAGFQSLRHADSATVPAGAAPGLRGDDPRPRQPHPLSSGRSGRNSRATFLAPLRP